MTNDDYTIDECEAENSEAQQHIATFEKHESAVRSYCRDFPAVFFKASGSKLVDVDGKTYVDFFSGAGALNYGHNNEILKTALIQYIHSDGVVHGLDFHTVAKSEFIACFERDLLRPRGLDYKLQFTGPTGTNAVEAALKLARKVTGRSNVIAFTNAFHGMSLGALSATTNPRKRRGAGLALSGTSFMPYEGYLGKDVDAFSVLQRMLEAGSGIDKPAAILLETVQGEGGLNYVSSDWAQKVQKLAREKDILLIVDDIQAGCGRCGTFFSFETLGISPDIVCLSKSLSGYGLPMSMNLIRPDIDIWEPGEHNGTFRGNNLAFVTARSAIEKFWCDKAFQVALAQKIEFLDARLNVFVEFFRSEVQGITAVGRGFMRGLLLPNPGMANEVSAEAFRRGLLVETCGVNSQVVKLLPALTIEQQTLRDGLDVLKSALDLVVLNFKARGR